MHMQPTHQTHAHDKHWLILTMLYMSDHVLASCQGMLLFIFAFENKIKDLCIFLEELLLKWLSYSSS